MELLARAGDLAAEALRIAVTYGPLPPGVMPVEAREDGAISWSQCDDVACTSEEQDAL